MARIRLDRVSIVRSALVVIETHSLEKLTLAAVADQLGVGSPALYNHLENLEELQYEVAIHSAEALTASLLDAVLGHSGDSAVVALANAYRHFARTNKAQFASTLRAPKRDSSPKGDSGLAIAMSGVVGVFERVLSTGYDLDDEAATDLARSVCGSLHGFAVLEVIDEAFGTEDDVARSFHRLVDTLLAGIRVAVR